MTREQIIAMAWEAKADYDNGVWSLTYDELERFAALVAAAERRSVLDTINELYGMERDTNNMFSEGYDYALSHIEEFVSARGQ